MNLHLLMNSENMTKEEQIWRNSENIAQAVFSLRNWSKVLKRYLPEDFQAGRLNPVSKEKLLQNLDLSIDIIAQKNRENMDLTSK